MQFSFIYRKKKKTSPLDLRYALFLVINLNTFILGCTTSLRDLTEVYGGGGVAEGYLPCRIRHSYGFYDSLDNG